MSARKKKPSISVPNTQAEAERLLFQIGAAQRAVTVIQARMNDALSAARAEFESEALPLNAAIEADFSALQAWAEAHRTELLDGKTKTVRLATGELSWRKTPPSVRLTKPEEVLKRLKDLGLSRFVRTKEEIDKEAMLGEPDAVKHVKGVTIAQKEEFVAQPFEETIERAEASATSEVRHGA
jgi:phage host-nuclease inhibitor protein Gam